jgi:hypothetical protein
MPNPIFETAQRWFGVGTIFDDVKRVSFINGRASHASGKHRHPEGA